MRNDAGFLHSIKKASIPPARFCPTPQTRAKRANLGRHFRLQQYLQNRVSRVRIFLPLPKNRLISQEIRRFCYFWSGTRFGDYTAPLRKVSNCPLGDTFSQPLRLVQHQKSIAGRDTLICFSPKTNPTCYWPFELGLTAYSAWKSAALSRLLYCRGIPSTCQNRLATLSL